jgi:hypothetical protein
MGPFFHQGGISGCPGVRFASVQGTGSFVAALPIRAAIILPLSDRSDGPSGQWFSLIKRCTLHSHFSQNLVFFASLLKTTCIETNQRNPAHEAVFGH